MQDARGCEVELIPVPLFGGNATDPLAISTYSDQSNRAHRTLGIGVFLLLGIWAGFVSGITPRAQLTFTLAGLTLICMGMYLLLWVFVLMYPSDITALHEYVSIDVTQHQHIAIGLLLIASGWIDVLFGARRLASKNWHFLSSLALALVGMIFMVHPQETFTSHMQHLFMGTGLSLGAALLCSAKREADSWKAVDHTSGDTQMVLAACLFGIAAITLSTFSEGTANMHYAHSITCNGGFIYTVFTYIIAGMILIAPTISGLQECCSLRFRRHLIKRHKQIHQLGRYAIGSSTTVHSHTNPIPTQSPPIITSSSSSLTSTELPLSSSPQLHSTHIDAYHASSDGYLQSTNFTKPSHQRLSKSPLSSPSSTTKLPSLPSTLLPPPSSPQSSRSMTFEQANTLADAIDQRAQGFYQALPQPLKPPPLDDVKGDLSITTTSNKTTSILTESSLTDASHTPTVSRNGSDDDDAQNHDDKPIRITLHSTPKQKQDRPTCQLDRIRPTLTKKTIRNGRDTYNKVGTCNDIHESDDSMDDNGDDDNDNDEDEEHIHIVIRPSYTSNTMANSPLTTPRQQPVSLSSPTSLSLSQSQSPSPPPSFLHLSLPSRGPINETAEANQADDKCHGDMDDSDDGIVRGQSRHVDVEEHKEKGPVLHFAYDTDYETSGARKNNNINHEPSHTQSMGDGESTINRGAISPEVTEMLHRAYYTSGSYITSGPAYTKEPLKYSDVDMDRDNNHNGAQILRDTYAGTNERNKVGNMGKNREGVSRMNGRHEHANIRESVISRISFGNGLVVTEETMHWDDLNVKHCYLRECLRCCCRWGIDEERPGERGQLISGGMFEVEGRDEEIGYNDEERPRRNGEATANTTSSSSSITSPPSSSSTSLNPQSVIDTCHDLVIEQCQHRLCDSTGGCRLCVRLSGILLCAKPSAILMRAGNPHDDSCPDGYDPYTQETSVWLLWRFLIYVLCYGAGFWDLSYFSCSRPSKSTQEVNTYLGDYICIDKCRWCINVCSTAFSCCASCGYLTLSHGTDDADGPGNDDRRNTT